MSDMPTPCEGQTEEIQNPLLGEPMEPKVFIETCGLWIEAKVKDAKATGVVIGLSGGIDSAVTAAIAARKVGVTAVWLPPVETAFDVPDPEEEKMKALAASLRVADFISVDCLATLSEVIKVELGHELKSRTAHQEEHVVMDNVASRLRMTMLYAIANHRNCLVLGTSNATELALGYFTKFGDGGCDIEPIGSLLKREVYQLAEELGVPKWVIDAAPSAGLWPGQTDEGEIGMTYKDMDLAVQTMIEDPSCQFDCKPLKLHGTREVFDKVLARLHKTEHKRSLPETFIL